MAYRGIFKNCQDSIEYYHSVKPRKCYLRSFCPGCNTQALCVCVPSQQPASHDCEKDLPVLLCTGIIGPQELLRDKKYACGLFIYFTYASVCEYDFLPRHLFMFACLCVWNFWAYCICQSAWSWLSAKKLLWLIE